MAPACAGIAVQILSGEYEQGRVDDVWFNEYSDNPVTYENTFTTYLYTDNGTQQYEELLRLTDTHEEFFFVFTNPEPGILVTSDIAVCEPLVSLPKTRNEIHLVTQACNDVIIHE